MLSAIGIQKEEFRASVDIRGERLPVVFRAYSLDRYAAMLDEIQSGTSGQGEKIAAQFLSEVLVSWELPTSPTDPTPYPTDFAALCAMPPDFVGAVLTGIAESRKPGK